MLYLSNNKVNKEIYIEHLKYLLNLYFFNINYEVITNNPYIAYNLFYPLPTHLITDEYSTDNKIVVSVENDNIYSFYGTSNKNRILLIGNVYYLYCIVKKTSCQATAHARIFIIY